MEIFPSSSVQHLLLFCIPLSSFNKITFTIFPAYIIYLFFAFIFNLCCRDTGSVCQEKQSEREEERGRQRKGLSDLHPVQSSAL